MRVNRSTAAKPWKCASLLALCFGTIHPAKAADCCRIFKEAASTTASKGILIQLRFLPESNLAEN
jgi:hypothetical protein